ncbi:ABC transporter ATP-binding protein [uncultured Roseovarius sp.]|uniref:ABC transporter ATP-binding protein n=1 Tax=uncultured Roseovarius sp. TaxID=293344 RepID=UPI00262F3CEF|nr:ABC transporter ATP-binding protein [uncultured Roseovarius sp.]
MSLSLRAVRAGYNEFRLRDVSLDIHAGSFTALIGPNGCGKSTLLKVILQLLRLEQGRITLAGQSLAELGPRHLARQIAYLPQHPVAPPGITVEDLVSYGRAPHQNFLGHRSRVDQFQINYALERVGMATQGKERVDQLSGGQRQRVFIALCLAQDAPWILLDEPTSFLDFKHQYETLDLLAELNRDGKTCVAVLHDIGQAARYADCLVVMQAGQVIAQGNPESVITPELMSTVYGVDAHIYADPVTGTRAVALKSNRGGVD